MFDKLVQLFKQLLPTGRAFKTPKDLQFETLIKALSQSESRWYADAISFMDSILPDNNNFTINDATDWEVRLALPNGSLNTLTVRKANILAKYNQQNINPAKSTAQNLQNHLQNLGFTVYVYENIPNNTPASYSYANTLVNNQYGQIQYGGSQYGSTYTNKIANYIDESKDLPFSIGGVYACTFFIGGATIGTSANVPVLRKNEFRQAILKYKPITNVGFTYINYV